MKSSNTFKSPRCTKGGIKIHQSENNCKTGFNDDQLEFYNKIKNQNKHTGVRIEKSDNNYDIDPFDGVDPFNNPNISKEISVKQYNNLYQNLDLNIDNYSQTELYKLFGITEQILTTDIMKICKKTVLKTHPDKSKIDQKYFLFFSKAYKRLFSIYEFQNKSKKNIKDEEEYSTATQQFNDTSKTNVLNKMFETNKSLRKKDNFNEWFNEQFEKHKLDDDTSGYGDWLKSDEDISNIENVTQANMGIEMEKKKKEIQALTNYNGISTQFFSSFGGSTLIDNANNFTSSGLFSDDGVGYSDLKQAYVESVIPVTEEDYSNIPKFKNVDEYNRYRSTQDITIPDKEESMKKLYAENKIQEEQSTALAYHYAKQAEQVKKNNQSFWSNIKQLTDKSI
jgi:curved DNA-binding protein CbpA